MNPGKHNSICQVSVYFKGDDLNPMELTRQFGVEPTRSHRKGDTWLTSSGKEVVERTGLWVLSIKSDEVSTAICEIASKILRNQIELPRPSSVEDGFVDVFVTCAADEDGGGTSEFRLDPECIAATQKLGMPLQFTVAVIRQ